MSVRIIVVWATLVFAGCRPHRTAGPPLAGEESALAVDDLVLDVSNNNWSDVIIYMVHDGRRIRFTMVTAARSASVAIPTRFISSNGTVQIVAHRIGGNDEYISPMVSVRLGHTVALTLESSLARSSVGVW
jgi:hypothetical protein